MLRDISWVSRNVGGRVNGLGNGDSESFGDVDAGSPALRIVTLGLRSRLRACIADSLSDDGRLRGETSRAGVEVSCGEDSGSALGWLGDCRGGSAVEFVLRSLRGLGRHNWVSRSLRRDSGDRGRLGVVGVLACRGRSFRCLGRGRVHLSRGRTRSRRRLDSAQASGVDGRRLRSLGGDCGILRSLARNLRDLRGLRVV